MVYLYLSIYQLWFFYIYLYTNYGLPIYIYIYTVYIPTIVYPHLSIYKLWFIYIYLYLLFIIYLCLFIYIHLYIYYGSYLYRDAVKSQRLLHTVVGLVDGGGSVHHGRKEWLQVLARGALSLWLGLS